MERLEARGAIAQIVIRRADGLHLSAEVLEHRDSGPAEETTPTGHRDLLIRPKGGIRLAHIQQATREVAATVRRVNPVESAPATLSETVITPPRRWGWPSARELWEYRDLLYFLTKRELQIRYKQSFFGISWAVLQPLVLAFIFALVFGLVIHTPTEGLPPAVFMVAGLVPWLFFSQAVTLGTNSLVLDAPLISKVYFPRLAIPVAKALSLIIDLVIAFVVVIAVGLIYGEAISSNVYLLPAFVLLGLVTTFAISSLSAAVNVKYRDVQLVMPMIVQVMFFITPVVLPGIGDSR